MVVALDPKNTVRASQLAAEYGAGAMVTMPERVVMTAAPRLWDTEALQEIHDPRLERSLRVQKFKKLIPYQDEKNKGKNEGKCRGVHFVSFPSWYFCPHCEEKLFDGEKTASWHPFKPLEKWLEDVDDNGDSFRTKPVCPVCGKPLVVSRLVVYCDTGHIDDFPWEEWLHKGDPKACNCKDPQIYIRVGDYSKGFGSIEIACASCHRKVGLSGVLKPEAFAERHIFCKGRHPWKGTYKPEHCDKRVKVAMRGASSLYYPLLVSSLVLPTGHDLIREQIPNTETYKNFMKFGGKRLKGKERLEALLNRSDGDDYVGDIVSDMEWTDHDNTDAHRNVVTSILKEMFTPDTSDDGPSMDCTSPQYREEEYDALTGKRKGYLPSEFYPEKSQDTYPTLPFLNQVVLVHTLREIRAQLGFSRMKPAMSSKDAGFVSLKSRDKDGAYWYPSYEVFGEGLFLEFKEDWIADWETAQNSLLQDRVAVLQKNYDATIYAENRPRSMTAKFLLLHTLAHLLIRQLSFACGYSIASLRERIYCNEAPEGKKMAGILIYTANGDSEGTLGGLVRQGYGDTLPHIFAEAVRKAQFCSNDPVCSLSEGQGSHSLNLAACHACVLLPETSCEEFNHFLDRGVIIGTMAHPELGFFHQSRKA